MADKKFKKIVLSLLGDYMNKIITLEDLIDFLKLEYSKTYRTPTWENTYEKIKNLPSTQD